MTMKRIRSQAFFSIVLAVLFVLWLGMDTDAFARAGGGKSSGSRGYSSGGSYQRSPSPTPSAPQRNYQQPQPQAQPAPPPPSAGRSFMSGLAGGLVGGMLGGMLFRSLGFAGSGMGEVGGFGFGDIFLLIVILGIIYFVVKRFRARQAAMQMSGAGAGGSSYSFPRMEPVFTPAPPPPIDAGRIPGLQGLEHIKSADAAFDEAKFKDLAEDVFFKIQGAWTRRNLESVRSLLSPDMFRILKRDLDDLVSRGQINRLENIAVREVEIVEAGQDHGEEYVTVRLYANLLDYVVDEKTGQTVSGNSSDPVKFIEFWTFNRNVGEKSWVLGGITQEEDR
ncbi:MAG TPA: Tim44 domain-containing protein [Thermodesulfobacteriota bacterium]|nr:Tim44 domain-containing protein [Thermodesulfobacteriota bacterium]